VIRALHIKFQQKSEASKSLELKSNQIWLKLVLRFLIQIPSQNLKNFNEEIYSLLNHLHVHILFGIFGAREGSLFMESMQIHLKNRKVYCSSRPAHRLAPDLPYSECAPQACPIAARGSAATSPYQRRSMPLAPEAAPLLEPTQSSSRIRTQPPRPFHHFLATRESPVLPLPPL
jgi:hypothetical protein